MSIRKKTIALVAHDGMKQDLALWVEENCSQLLNHKFICTGTTGLLVEKTISDNNDESRDIEVVRLKSGPLGGDQQLGALMATGEIDMVVFLCDPMTAQPHDVDVKALIRLASVYNVPMALNLSTADFLISSPLFNGAYTPKVKDYSQYVTRVVNDRV